MARLSLFLFVILLSFNARSQTASRVIAFARYGADTTIASVDSGGYKYAGSNGGEILCALNEFNEDFPFVYVPTYDFESGFRGLVKSDSAWETGPGDTDVSLQFFDGHNNIIYAMSAFYSDGVWYNYGTVSYTYDANNNLVQEIDTLRHGADIFSIDLFTYTYGADNRVVQETDLYKSSPDSANWHDGYKTIYTYDGSGNLTMIKYYGWDDTTNSFGTADADSQKYTYNGSFPDTVQSYAAPPSEGATGVYYFSADGDTMILTIVPVENYITIINTYDNHHNKISSTKLVNPLISGLTPYKYDWSYNAYNQVTCQRYYNLDTSTNSWIFTNLVRFYYEPYINTATPAITGSNELILFPSPAKGSINVKLNWSAPQPFTMAIYNTAGIKIKEWNIPATQQYQQTINLPGLPPGNYTLSAISANQMLVKKFVLLN